MSLTIVWALAFIIAYVAACGTHPTAAWESQTSYLQYCITLLQFEEAYAISDFVLDVNSSCVTASFGNMLYFASLNGNADQYLRSGHFK